MDLSKAGTSKARLQLRPLQLHPRVKPRGKVNTSRMQRSLPVATGCPATHKHRLSTILPRARSVFDAPAGVELTSINIDSVAGIFTGSAAESLGGSFDNDADANIFKATFGGSFGSVSFGNVAQTGLAKDFVLNDLSVVGSLAGGGDLGNVDLVYVPEPACDWIVCTGAVGRLFEDSGLRVCRARLFVLLEDGGKCWLVQLVNDGDSGRRFDYRQ